jgi:Ca2+-binding RTX toxin-like protein
MARFVWHEGNRGFYGYGDLHRYAAGALAAEGTELTWAAGQGDADPAVHAASIRLTFRNATTYVVESGPDAGQVRVTGGALAGVEWRDAAGTALLTVTGLSVPLPVFLATLARGDGFAAWSMLAAGGNRVLGSDDAGAAGPAGTGDVLDTGLGDDTVTAGGGDDFVRDGGGADSYSGGAGFDTLAYDGWFFRPYLAVAGLQADLAAGTVTGPDGAVDRVAGFEAVTGTFHADAIHGDGRGNRFAGLAGRDRLDGRGGFDWASYAQDAAQGGTDGIRANLARGTVRDGFGTLDTLVGIEGVAGTGVRDTLADGAGNNAFDGGGGNDALVLSGGNDTATGGAGADSFTFRGTAFDDDRITDFSQADGDVILFDAATAFAQLTLSDTTLDGAPAALVQFGSGTVTLAGIAAADLAASDFGF